MDCEKISRPVVKRITSLEKIREWEDRVSENKKFWTFVAIRLPTSAVFDYISYAAGLTKMSFTKFSLATLIGGSPALFSFYFFGGIFFQSGFYYYLVAFLGVVVLIALIFGKERLIERLYKMIKEVFS